jgi:hypothetical protein
MATVQPEPRIEDQRPHYYFQVQNDVIDERVAEIGATAFLVYCAILRAAMGTGRAMPSQRTMAKVLNLSRNTIAAAMQKLIAAGMIAVEERQTEQGEHLASVVIILDARTVTREGVAQPVSRVAQKLSHPVVQELSHIVNKNVVNPLVTNVTSTSPDNVSYINPVQAIPVSTETPPPGPPPAKNPNHLLHERAVALHAAYPIGPPDEPRNLTIAAVRGALKRAALTDAEWEAVLPGLEAWKKTWERDGGKYVITSTRFIKERLWENPPSAPATRLPEGATIMKQWVEGNQVWAKILRANGVCNTRFRLQ